MLSVLGTTVEKASDTSRSFPVVAVLLMLLLLLVWCRVVAVVAVEVAPLALTPLHVKFFGA